MLYTEHFLFYAFLLSWFGFKENNKDMCSVSRIGCLQFPAFSFEFHLTLWRSWLVKKGLIFFACVLPILLPILKTYNDAEKVDYYKSLMHDARSYPLRYVLLCGMDVFDGLLDLIWGKVETTTCAAMH